MRRIFAWALALGALAGAASPTFAQSASSGRSEAKRAEHDVDTLLAQFDEHLFARRYAEALRVADQLAPDFESAEGRAFVAAMRASALLGLKRDKEAAQQIERVQRLAPKDPWPTQVLVLGGLIAQRSDVAADALDRMIAHFPDAVLKLDRETLFAVLREAPKSDERRNDDRKIALARINYGGPLLGDYLVEEAIGILLKRGETEAAAGLLRYVDQPTLIESMLIQRRYAPLWDRLANAGGANLRNFRESSVKSAERAFDEKPGDMTSIHQLAEALRHAGRYEEAIALRARLPVSAAAMASADETVGWAVNNIAFALHEAGRGDDADRLLAMLTTAPMEPGRGRWRVSMIINRLELLVIDGKYERALPLVDATEASAREDGNPYARQLVRRLRFCTMIGLGRKEEAAKLRQDVIDHAKDAWHATVDSMLCANDLDMAEKIALDALKSDDGDSFQEAFVRAMQPVPLSSDDPSLWQDRWSALRKRPAVAAEYDRLGRDMPVSYLPAKK